MAQMYPETPRECTEGSLEKSMFEALEKLPQEFCVFHSFSIVCVTDDTLYESETDFVIFHPKKGLLCIEAKAGRVDYRDGEWKYGSGIPMNHDGPFNQAAQNKWKLKKYIEDQKMGYMLQRCKLLHAVWFPSVPIEYIKQISLPSEADINIILTNDSLNNIEEDINRIFNIEVSRGVQTQLGVKDSELLMRKVLAPSFKLIALSEIRAMHRKNVFKSMLKEQVALLNYLQEQNCAVINGMAGTGKTIMAVEKARIHSDSGEHVLFLCYNVKLKEHLKNAYNYEYVDYYTIDGLAVKLCDTAEADYALFKEKLLEYYVYGGFPWQHIIIDEGQDFGQERIDEINLIDLLKDIVVSDVDSTGSFYVFYDKNQLVQSRKVPDYIRESDCKLTLYRNSRNTENIAITSNRLLGNQKKPKVSGNPLPGNSPEFYISSKSEDYIDTINRAIDSIIEKNVAESIVIITSKTEKLSKMSEYCKEGFYLYRGNLIMFTTYRKFKGLEADAVVVIDIDAIMLNPENIHKDKTLYVGSSRARYELSLVANISKEECLSLLEKMNISNSRSSKRPFKSLATFLNAKYMELRE